MDAVTLLTEARTNWRCVGALSVYLPDFLDGFDRLVAFDAETTGKRTPHAEFIRKQPFARRAPGIIIEVGLIEMLRDGEGWRKGETWGSRVNPDGPIDPEAIKIHGIRPSDLKNAPRFPTILPQLKDFIGDSPIVAHAYKNERDFLDYEFARAKEIQWGESTYLRSATFARRYCSRSFSLERSSR
jgi:DNA polymerase-3 subunit epsilon